MTATRLAEPVTITLGCRLNHAESAAIAARLAERAGERPLVVVNSCAVTGEAVRSTRQAIRRARRERPDARIIVTGCAAEIEPESFAAMAEVDAVVGNGDKLDPTLYDSTGPAIRRPAHGAAPSHGATGRSAHARAMLAVQTGCDHSCTFCIIPQGRGPSRSLPAGAVVEEARALVAAGHPELVLTGVDLTSWGHDLPGSPTLGGLVERLLVHVPGLARLRLSSLDGIEIDSRLFELITREARIAPHVHLSLQAGDDMILKRMKRRHSRADAVRLVERLHAARPDIAVGADLIAGFPTEDAAMAARSLALIDDCRIVHAHIFAFSPRAGTPAARMPQLDRRLVAARAAALRERAGAARRAWFAALVGTHQSVLVESGGDYGHAANFAPVRLAERHAPRSLIEVRIAAADKRALIAEPAHG
mgnify:CR=1 FL=1